MNRVILMLSLPLLLTSVTSADPAPALRPVVEVEEPVFTWTEANNGAAPMWCYGSTCLVRIGERVFASGLETLADAVPLFNVRWLLFERGGQGWAQVQADPAGRTREPCPLACFPDGRFFLSAHPTLLTDRRKQGGGPARPEVLQFAAADAQATPQTLLPAWGKQQPFSDHTYRTFTADGPNRELLLMNNIGNDYSAWAFYDRDGRWSATGELYWPELRPGDVEPYGAKYCRANYPTVLLKDRAAYFCGAAAFDNWDRVKDPVADKDKMGRQWGGRWRRLFYTWSPDLTETPFQPWVEISNTMASGGWLFPGDLWVSPDGTAHVLWFEGALNRSLRDKFFPDLKLYNALHYAQVKDGKVVQSRALVESGEGYGNETPGSRPRFHVTPDNRLFACYYVSGTDAAGQKVAEDRVMEIHPDGRPGPAVRLPLTYPLYEFFTATVRGGCAPSTTLDLLGPRVGSSYAISYARVRLW